jgi:hypothetical protein
MNTGLLDTLNTVVDTIKTAVDTTLVNAAPVIEKTIWQDKTLMTTFGIIGGLLLLLIVIIVWDVVEEKRK